MTNQETLQITVDLWNAFLEIPENEKHPDDQNEFRFHIHALQNILISCEARKRLPYLNLI